MESCTHIGTSVGAMTRSMEHSGAMKRQLFFFSVELSNEKNLGWLGYIGDYPTQYIEGL